MTAEKAINGLLQLGLPRRGHRRAERALYFEARLRGPGGQDLGALGRCGCASRPRAKPIKAKTLGQKAYVDAMNANTITLGIGPAGTGQDLPRRGQRPSRPSAARRGEPHHPDPPRGRGGRAPGLPARRPPEQGRPVPAPALRRALRDARAGDVQQVSRAPATSRSRRSRTCAAARWTTASSSSTRRRTPRASR